MSAPVEEMKLAVVGGGGVGKSAITIQFVQNAFVETYDPTIEDSYRKHFKVNDAVVFAEILDTAGQEEYKALRDSYMRNQDGFVCTYSIIDKKSFEEITTDFIEHIRRVKDTDRFPCVLFGNKNDMESERTIKKEEAKMYAESCGAVFMEGSAKRRLGIDEAFHELVKQVRAERQKQLPKDDKIIHKKKCMLL
jgi:GTPase KRas protein